MGAKSTTKRKLETGSKTGVINLSGKKLTAFPKKILNDSETFGRLRSLDLSNNRLCALDDVDLSELTCLKTLNLRGNSLRSVTSLGGLTALQVLDLSRNSLVSLPLLPTKALKSVDVSSNALVLLDFPHSQHTISDGNSGRNNPVFSKLKAWNASHNQLAGIAAAFFSQCVKLERLDVSHNCLEEFVGQVSMLKKLNHMDASHNNLSALPEEIGQCIFLQTLLVNHNRLSSIPAALLENGALSRLRLEGNPNITKDVFLALEGAAEYMERRKARIETQIHGGLHDTDRSVCGLD